MELNIKFTHHYKLALVGPEDLIARFKSHFTVTHTSRFMIGGVNVPKKWIDKEVETRLYLTYQEIVRKKEYKTLFESIRSIAVEYLMEGHHKDLILLNAGMIDYVVVYISFLKQSGLPIKINDYEIPKLDPIKIPEKWQEILTNPKYGNQLEHAEKLIRFYGGIADIYTGFGKSEIILSIADGHEGNSLLLVPTNSIKEELHSRAKKYGVDIPKKFDVGSKINIINPVGFCRSKNYHDPEISEYLSQVEMTISDECHRLAAASITNLFNTRLENLKRSYGFSASPDANKGMTFHPAKTTIEKYSVAGATVLGLTGTVRTKVTPQVDVTLVKVFGGFSDPEFAQNQNEKEQEDFIWSDSVNHFTEQNKLAIAIKQVLAKFPDLKFYIPIFKTESGQVLYEQLSKYTRCLLWSSGNILPEALNKKEYGDELTRVKRAIELLDYRVLISTTVGYEGVDIPSLGGVIPLTGTNFRMVLQPVGRSSRSKSVVIVLIYDKNNPIILSQSKKRRLIIEATYNVVKTLSLQF